MDTEDFTFEMLELWCQVCNVPIKVQVPIARENYYAPKVELIHILPTRHRANVTAYT
jgi:hypothetical protein